MRLPRFITRAICIATAALALGTGIQASRADFASTLQQLLFDLSNYNVAPTQTLWLGGTISCAGLSTTKTTTVTFSSSTYTYTCNGHVYSCTVPGGTITYNPKCNSATTSYSNGWSTTAPCNANQQFIAGCLVTLPSNCSGSISSCSWSSASCKSSASGVSCDWKGTTYCYSHLNCSYNNCNPGNDGNIHCGGSCNWSSPCSGGHSGGGNGGGGTGNSPS